MSSIASSAIRWATRGERATSRLSSRRAADSAHWSRTVPVPTITAIRAAARYSPVQIAPATANRARMSTPPVRWTRPLVTATVELASPIRPATSQQPSRTPASPSTAATVPARSSARAGTSTSHPLWLPSHRSSPPLRAPAGSLSPDGRDSDRCGHGWTWPVTFSVAVAIASVTGCVTPSRTSLGCRGDLRTCTRGGLGHPPNRVGHRPDIDPRDLDAQLVRDAGQRPADLAPLHSNLQRCQPGRGRRPPEHRTNICIVTLLRNRRFGYLEPASPATGSPGCRHPPRSGEGCSPAAVWAGWSIVRAFSRASHRRAMPGRQRGVCKAGHRAWPVSKEESWLGLDCSERSTPAARTKAGCSSRDCNSVTKKKSKKRRRRRARTCAS